jgi:hypothetical protein
MFWMSSLWKTRVEKGSEVEPSVDGGGWREKRYAVRIKSRRQTRRTIGVRFLPMRDVMA